MEGPREGWRELPVDQSWRETGGEDGREKVDTVLSVMDDTCRGQPCVLYAAGTAKCERRTHCCLLSDVSVELALENPSF